MLPQRFVRAVGAAAALAACHAAMAQPVVVVPPRLISTAAVPADANYEPAIVGIGNHVLVGWNHTAVGALHPTIAYATSNDGLASLAFGPADLPDPAGVPCPVDTKADPMVAASPQTGALYLGSLLLQSGLDGPNATIVVGRTAWGSTGPLTNIVQVTPCGSADKCFMTIGPDLPPATMAPTPYSERAYVGYSALTPLRTVRSLSSTVVATAWPLNGEAGAPTPVRCNGAGSQIGRGAFPLVLGNNSIKPGRLMLGYTPSIHVFKPEVTASDVGGGGGLSDWIQVSADRRLDRYFDPLAQQTVLILGTADYDIPGFVNVPLPGGADALTWPSMSLDPRPTHGDTLVAAFAGRLPSDTQRLVLFLAECTNAGSGAPAFVLGSPITPPQRWLLTGSLLGVPGASVWMPSVAIDSLGGINLVFAWTMDIGNCSSCNPPRTTVRYVRWSSIDEVAAGHAPSYIADLSPQFFALYGTGNNDYLMVNASGCHIYIAWAQQTVANQWDIYAAHFRAGASCL